LVIIGVLVLVSVTLITFDERSGTNHITSGLKSIAHDVFSPLTSGVNDILRPIGDFFAGAVHYGALQQENQQLQALIGQLRMEVNETGALRQTVRELTSLADVPYLGSLKTVTAQMINFDLSDFDADITIGKGTSSGVTKGEPVVGAGGLVGQVESPSEGTATVQLITDSRSEIGVSYGPKDETYAVVVGQGPGNPLAVEYVPNLTHLHIGEMMYTNGLAGGAFPPDIPVGRVRSIKSNVGTPFMTVTLTPAANLDQLAYVDVVEAEPPL
jgi:rod shape-determining protein MreC